MEKAGCQNPPAPPAAEDHGLELERLDPEKTVGCGTEEFIIEAPKFDVDTLSCCQTTRSQWRRSAFITALCPACYDEFEHFLPHMAVVRTDVPLSGLAS